MDGQEKTQSKKTKMDKTGNGNGLDAMTLKKTFLGSIWIDSCLSRLPKEVLHLLLYI